MKLVSVAFLAVSSAAILHRGSAVKTSMMEPGGRWANDSNGLDITAIGHGGDSFDRDGSFEVCMVFYAAIFNDSHVS
jgi:hypothetical protein